LRSRTEAIVTGILCYHLKLGEYGRSLLFSSFNKGNWEISRNKIKAGRGNGDIFKRCLPTVTLDVNSFRCTGDYQSLVSGSQRSLIYTATQRIAWKPQQILRKDTLSTEARHISRFTQEDFKKIGLLL
jgi:hypothetical protein